MDKTSEATQARLRTAGAAYGRELAAAVVLAAERAGGNRELKRHMTQVVLRKIGEAAGTLRELHLPDDLVAAFEQACRAACRDELVRTLRLERPEAGAPSVRTAA